MPVDQLNEKDIDLKNQPETFDWRWLIYDKILFHMQAPIKKICVHFETKQWRNKMVATVTLYLTFTLILDLGIYS